MKFKRRMKEALFKSKGLPCGSPFEKYSYGKLNVFTKNTAICARLTAVSGQYVPAAQPEVIPSAASCLIHAAAQ